MNITLVTPPSTEPITVDQAAKNVFGDSVYDQEKLTRDIKAARKMAESYCEMSFINQTWKMTLSQFPLANHINKKGAIYLPRGLAQSITSVAYVDSSESSQTLTEGTEFVLKTTGNVSRLELKDGYNWPSVSTVSDEAVTITWVSGLGETFPSGYDDIEVAILLMVGTLYEIRQTMAGQEMYANELFEQFLAPYKIYFDFELYNQY